MRGAWKVILAALAAVLLWPAASAQRAEARAKATCEQSSPTVFVLRGRIDDAMTACVRERLAPTTTELVVDSEGGEAGAGLDIADLLQGRGLTIRVREWCNSSCANFLLPMARRLVIEPGAMIQIHGGIDPAHLARFRADHDRLLAGYRAEGATPEAAEQRYAKTLARLDGLVPRQRAFAMREGVRPGWLLYREAAAPNHIDGLSGTAEGLMEMRLLIVEERLLRSCLPRVEVEPFQAGLEQRFLNNPRRYASLRRQGAIRSADLHCDPAP